MAPAWAIQACPTVVPERMDRIISGTSASLQPSPIVAARNEQKRCGRADDEKECDDVPVAEPSAHLCRQVCRHDPAEIGRCAPQKHGGGIKQEAAQDECGVWCHGLTVKP